MCVDIGILFAILQSAIYPYLPIPAMLAVLWATGGLIMGLGIGTIASLVYRK